MDLKLITTILARLSGVVLCIGLLRGLFFYKKMNPLHKSLLFYLALMLFLEIAGFILVEVYNNNLILLHVFSFTEVLFFVYFFNKRLLPKPNSLLIALGVAGAVYIFAEFCNYFIINTINVKEFQPYAKVVDNFIVIIMALFFFYQRANSFCETRWTNFRLNAAILIFFTINAIMFLPFNFFINDESGIQFYIWNINIVVIALFYIYLVSLIWACSIKARVDIA